MDAELAQRFVGLWVVVDPLGTLPVFMAVAAGLTPAQSRRLALRAGLVAFGVLAGFALGGEALLRAIDVDVESFRIAGGLVLFLFALHLIFGEPKHESDLASAADLRQAAVFPLAIPSLASPGAMMAATLAAWGGGGEGVGALVALALIAAVMATAVAILAMAGPLHRLIGDSGSALISRVMGMILAAVAVDEVLKALATLGVIDMA